MMRIYLSVPDDDIERIGGMLRTALPHAVVAAGNAESPAVGEGIDADYVVSGYRDESLFDRQRKMKAIFLLSAGVGHLLSLPNLPRDVPLIRLEDAGMAGQMLRYVLAATLRVSQRLDRYARQQRERVWERLDPRAPREMIVGVLGLGAIGARIAEALVAQGFVVRGFARTPKRIPGVQCMSGDRFEAFVTGLDVLVNVVPLTPETERILNARTFSRMAQGGHLINISRGGHLDERDLLDALDTGTLSGATLDVFDDEPLPADHPFWGRPDIDVTPHISGVTLHLEAVEQIADKIRRLERGLPVSGLVDRERGY